MSDTAVAHDHDHDDDAEKHDGHHHPPDSFYVRIAAGLALLTALEVALIYIEGLEGLPLLVFLLVIMAIKFVVVASNFMHLKFDDRILTRVFYAGLILAATVYMIALLTFRVFDDVECDDPASAPVPISCQADD